MAINHAQLLGWDFKQEEFDSGVVGQLMIDEEFDFDKAVSLCLQTQVCSLPHSNYSQTRVHVFTASNSF